MTARGTLPILFLYLALVWVGSAYFSPENFVRNALFLTTIGIALLLLLAICSWIYGMWQVIAARNAVRRQKPVAVRPAAPVANEDDVALKALLREAAVRLSTSPKFTGRGADELLFSGMPLFLVVGSEGGGKTSVVVNSSMDAELLAGQASLEKTAPAPTNLANIWLVGDSLFVEIGGRHFSGDLRRWEELLHILTARPKTPFWMRLWKGERPGFELRGILHCCDVRFFLSKPAPEQIERKGQLAQERLRAAVKVFERRIPVYTIFTKGDQVPYFKDFFGRFAENEAHQVFGSTLPLSEMAVELNPGAFSAVETKRLSKALHKLYCSLAERRISLLFHEPQATKKPKIYEFPREFNRIRQSIVSFLVQMFRPSSLEPGPVNRGLYFCGTREVEAAPANTSGFTSSVEPARESPRLADATYIFQQGPPEPKSGGSDVEATWSKILSGGFRTQWMFLQGLFQEIVLRDRVLGVFSIVPKPGEKKRRTIAMVATTAAAAIALIVLTYSWVANRSLLLRVEAAAASPAVRAELQQGLPSSENLTALEQLRQRVEELSSYQRDGAPIRMRAGLYAGNQVTDAARAAYFRHFNRSLLDKAHGTLATYLSALPNPTLPDAPPDEAVTNRLKTYVMIASPRGCELDSGLVSRELRGVVQTEGLREADPRFALAGQQIDFYSKELEFKNPVSLDASAEARTHALDYLKKSSSIERVYRALLAEIGRDLPAAEQLVDLSPDYPKVLSGPRQAPAAIFSEAGWNKLHARLESGKPVSQNDPCISSLQGGATNVDELDVQVQNQIVDLYSRQYLEAWRSYLSQFSVSPYTDAQDAAQKLELLSSYRSPLLLLFKFVSDHTNFPRQEAPTQAEGIVGTLEQIKERIKGSIKKVEAPPPDVRFTLGGVDSSFLPVRAVVPPKSQVVITDKTTAYMDGLAALRTSMQAIASGSGNNLDAIHTSALQVYQQAYDNVGKISRVFPTDAVGALSEVVERLLKEPIVKARPFIVTDTRVFQGRDFIAALQILCTPLRTLLNKYPFDQSGQDLSLPEFSQAFAPESGHIWKTLSKELMKFVVRDKGVWKSTPEAPNQKTTSDLIDFLNRAQHVSDAFFSEGGTNPKITFVVRPKLANPEQVIQLQINGRTREFSRNSQLQQQFNWPGTDTDANGRTGTAGFSSPFSSHDGPWAVFRMFADAEMRPLLEKALQWKKARGATGRFAAIDPPVQLEIVEFPAGIDIFNPSFFMNLRCPVR